MYAVAGVFNLLLAGFFLAAPRTAHAALVAGAGPEHPLMIYLFAIVVGVFGCGYIAVARNVARNLPIVRMAVAAKLLIFVAVVATFVPGWSTRSALAIACGDLIFATLFIVSLNAHARADV